MRVMVANRGEIAARVLRTCDRLGIETVLAVSEADLASPPAAMATRTVCVGPATVSRSYLNREGITSAALALGCDAVHPGYGFLAEDPDFARMCADAGVTFVGPTPSLLRLFGDKALAREAARGAGVPVVPGSDPVLDVRAATAAAEELGYPVMLKASKGGGGRGLRIVRDRDELEVAFPVARSEAVAAFGDGTVYLERWVANARHVEVQVVASAGSDVVHLGDRDCSVQRRNQKLIEEAPAPMLAPALRDALRASAVELAEHVGYDNIGTVEFLVDVDADAYYFLEVNPRIQVEHGITELVTGIDIVGLQLQAALTGTIDLSQRDVELAGTAIEARINAEDPRRGFRPCPGAITRWRVPQGAGIRVDSHCTDGYVVPPHYDSLVAKVMVHRPDREAARDALVDALTSMVVDGIETTTDLVRWIVSTEDFGQVDVTTRWLDDLLGAGDGPFAAAAPRPDR